jgi:hypothetical protein
MEQVPPGASSIHQSDTPRDPEEEVIPVPPQLQPVP